MAVDKTVKLKIRAYYESNNLSAAKVHNFFEGYDVSKKTIEYWITNEKWKKNKYADEAQALEKLVDDKLEKELFDEYKQNLSKNISNIPDEDKEQFEDELSKVNFFKVLSANSLKDQLAKNLIRGETFAMSAKNIGTVKTYHDMLTSTIQTVYGKQYNHKVIDPNEKVYSDEELEQMSIEDLEQLTNSKG